MTAVLKQEDSHFVDYGRGDNVILDANWTGKWEIENSAGTAVASGTATLSADNYKLEFRVKSTDTVTLLGTYTLIYEITNAVLGFQKEIKETLVFKTQNIT